MAMNWIQEALMNLDYEDEFEDLSFEIPQLTRRNAQVMENKPKCLIEVSKEIYNKEEECAICFQKRDKSALKCGHAFCDVDVQYLIDKSDLNIVQCPICRANQEISHIEELRRLKSQIDAM